MRLHNLFCDAIEWIRGNMGAVAFLAITHKDHPDIWIEIEHDRIKEFQFNIMDARGETHTFTDVFDRYDDYIPYLWYRLFSFIADCLKNIEFSEGKDIFETDGWIWSKATLDEIGYSVDRLRELHNLGVSEEDAQ